jgi:hypothetical protein
MVKRSAPSSWAAGFVRDAGFFSVTDRLDLVFRFAKIKKPGSC